MQIPKTSADIDTVVEFYLQSVDYRKLKPKTQKDYATHLVDALDTIVEGKRLGDYRNQRVRVRHIADAYEQWQEVGLRTANYRKAALSVAWKYAMRYDVMPHNPIAYVKTRQPKPRRVYWTRDQVTAFLSTAYSKWEWRSLGLIVHMSYDWAQRVGDMRLLTWDTLDLDACKLELTQSKRSADVKLPISKNLCNMLRQQKEDFGFQEYVAPKPNPVAGKYVAYDKEHLSNHINTILKEANLPHELTAMDLRRTAVTEMMEAGVSEGNIMQVTGHKSFDSMIPYRVNTFSGASKALAARGNDNE